MLHCTLGELFPFIESKEGFFALITCNRKNNAVEHFRGPLDNIQMAVGDGIKASGIDNRSHSGSVNGVNQGGELPVS